MSAPTLEQVQRALALTSADNFDPETAKRHMSVQPRPLAPPPGVLARQAAVLLLLYPEGDHLLFPLMRRTETNGTHSGQISLPGGRQEPGETAEQTALREAEEEMGIRPADVSVIGGLARIYVPPSNFEIQPIVGISRMPPAWALEPSEVAELVIVPVDLLLDDTLKSERAMTRAGDSFMVRVYNLLGNEVWGATAAILGEFEARLRAITGV